LPAGEAVDEVGVLLRQVGEQVAKPWGDAFERGLVGRNDVEGGEQITQVADRGDWILGSASSACSAGRGPELSVSRTDTLARMTDAAASPVSTINAMLEQLVPRAHEMGVRFLEMRPGFVLAEVPFEGNGNHFGVIYAGVIFTLAEVLGGALHFATFDATTHYPLVKRLTIDFHSPGRGRLLASAALAEDEIARIRAAATPDAKVRFVLEAEVVGEDGTLVARTRGGYQIRPFGQ
jgi:acyl-coenzyme A thioesterase PaaI-like protein